MPGFWDWDDTELVREVLKRTRGLSLLDAAAAVGVGKTSIIRWRHDIRESGRVAIEGPTRGVVVAYLERNGTDIAGTVDLVEHRVRKLMRSVDAIQGELNELLRQLEKAVNHAPPDGAPRRNPSKRRGRAPEPPSPSRRQVRRLNGTG